MSHWSDWSVWSYKEKEGGLDTPSRLVKQTRPVPRRGHGTDGVYPPGAARQASPGRGDRHGCIEACVSDPGLIDLSNRLTLRLAEVAQVLGVSERTVRRHLHELEGAVWRYGETVLVSVEGLREVDRRNRKAGAERAREVREREARRRLGSSSNAAPSEPDGPPPCIGRSKIEPAQKRPGKAFGSAGTSA